MNDDQRRRQGRPPVIVNARERILEEAAALFARSGYEAITIADLAVAIGATKAAVYHYFKTKQDIYDAIILSTLADLIAANTGHDGGSASERLRAFMVGHARFFEANYWRFSAMLIGFGGIDNQSVLAEAKRLRRSYESYVRGIIQSGVDEGEFDITDITAAGRMVLSCLNWMVRWFEPGLQETAEAVADTYFGLLSRGFARR